MFVKLRLIILALIMFCICVECEAAEFDIFITKGAEIISVEKLRPAEKVTSKEILSAKKKIELARDNKKLLEPLAVIERGDGNYTIIEGSEIFAAMKELGAESLPVIVHSHAYQKNVKTIEDLYKLNLAAEEEFHLLMKNLQEEYGGELTKRPHIKSEARVREKTKLELNGDYSQITDMFAASLIYPDEESLLATYDKIKNRADVICIEDRWHKPLPGGYRDIQLNIILSNGAICELQLHHAATMQIKETLDHPLYEFVRSNRKNPAMEKYVARAVSIQKILYESVYDGTFSNVSDYDKKILEDTAKKISKQKSPLILERLLNRMERILKYNFGATNIAA